MGEHYWRRWDSVNRRRTLPPSSLPVGAVSGIITLIVSAVFGYATGGGYGLGVTSGLLGFLVCSVMILWMVFTNLNEFDPAWIIFLVVICISALFAFIAGILFAIAQSNLGVGAVAAAFNFIHLVVAAVVIFFWIRSRGLVPETSMAHSEHSGEYQEW